MVLGWRKDPEAEEEAPPSPDSPSTRSAGDAVTNYQSFGESATATSPNGLTSSTEAQSPTSMVSGDPRVLYRGFSTSISDLFADPQYERIDCCALTCCGVLQHDRDRYLISGIPPPSFFKRLVVHLLVPVTIFFAAGMAAMRIRDKQLNQMMSTGLVFLLLFYLYLQCAKGRDKRRYVRQEILRAKHQLHHSRSSPRDRDHLLGQTEGDIDHAHPTCCGCYTEDRPGRSNARDDNVCGNTYEVLCPDFCGMHCQLCGVCGIAQEARDLEGYVLPASYRRIDYITMQPIVQYYASVYAFQHGEPVPSNSSSVPRIAGHPLSKLAYNVLQCFAVFLGLALTLAVLGPFYWKKVLGRRYYNLFGVADFVLLVLTIGQSIAVLLVARYLVDRHVLSHLSTDAVVKYFASGFFLAASLAIFWELVAVSLIDTFISLVLAAVGIVSQQDPETNLVQVLWPGSSYLTSISGSPRLLRDFFADNVSAGIGRPEYAEIFGMDHPVLYSIYIFVATFLVAGLIEELCKYFGYRMVEHPDFLTKEELEESSTLVSGRGDEDDEDADDDEAAPTSLQPMDYSQQNSSVQRRGAAVTLAMVAVAVGFACCEDLMYVFIYGGGSFRTELGVLMERTLFPVHPILAAIQSVRVCQRELEGDRAIRIFQTILPAVLFHGSFDFLIVFVSFMGRLLGQTMDRSDLKISSVAEFISLLCCVGVMAASVVYLYRASNQQRVRLAALDGNTISVDPTSLL